ncbi:hypothetical protein P8S55_06080 [Halomonas sp. M1]|uniref:hypothetical protein n=1 Tax=Halomonas sp. M1 TaxID=3035470 RepID=UPI00248514EB|nr:hypothetical protein [Halomonas sp. M1]WFE72654.1 hypothetical protein P8S55_06080 [Halomonas sp. M1]
MKILHVFKQENEFIAENYSAALSRFEKAVETYERSKWASLDYSSYALAKILDLDNSRELPMLIEALCNLTPSLLTPKYYFVENGEVEEMTELEVSESINKKYIINPLTGLEDFDFKKKVIRRFVLSEEVLESEL